MIDSNTRTLFMTPHARLLMMFTEPIEHVQCDERRTHLQFERGEYKSTTTEN